MQKLIERVTSKGTAAAAIIRCILERTEGHKRVRMVLFFVLLALIGGVMLLLNLHTPMMMDDYDYSFSWATGEPVSGLADVIASQAAHYGMWGGRSVVHAIAQIFLSMNKTVFGAVNACMYLLLLLEIYALAKPRERAYCWSILLAAHAVLFTCVPFFGTVFLWLTGSCNYLWGTVLALLPLMILKSAQEGGFFSRGGHGWLALPICFLAGWTNENTACGMLALVFVVLIGLWLLKRKVFGWQWAAFAAQALGAAVMLLAPGNYARASSYETGSMLLELIRRAVMATAYGGVYVGALLMGVVLLWALCTALGVKKRAANVLILLLGAAGAAYSMIASPVFSDRSWTGVIVLALIAVLVLLGDIEEQSRAFDAAKMLALPLALFLIAYGGYQALGDVRAHEEAWLAQVSRMEQAQDSGLEEVDIDSVYSHSRFTMSIALEEDAALWPNSTLSKAYGVNVN